MSSIFLSKKSLDILKLDSSKYPRRVGFEISSVKEIDLTHPEGKLVQKAGVIESVFDDSCLLPYLKEGDILVSVGKYHYHDSNWIDVSCINEENKSKDGGYACLRETSSMKLEDGQQVDVKFFRKVKSKSDKQKQQEQEESYESLTVSVTFNWCYFVKDEDGSIAAKASVLKVLRAEKSIKESLFNQDHAVDQVLKSLKLKEAGLKENNKPIGSYLFTGPTGVGKTELAKILAEELGCSLVRIDMSEYMQSHSVHRLIGAPPSYIGYGEETILEKEIGSKGKKVVLLLDEVEKAHEDIQKVFLQAMDNSKVTLGNSKEIDFSNTLILMTSNCGIVQKNSLGLVASQEVLSVDMEKIKEYFLPEFIGRLSGVVKFNPLDEKACRKIIAKLVKEFNSKHLSSKGVTLEITPELGQHLLEKGFDKMYGARTVKNFFKDVVLDKVADKIFDSLLTGSSIKGETLIVDYKNGKVELIVKGKLTQSADNISDEENDGPRFRVIG